MRIEHDEFEKVYIRKMNRLIKDLDGYEEGMEVVHIGSGIEIRVSGVAVANPILSGMLGIAHKQTHDEIENELRELGGKLAR